MDERPVWLDGVADATGTDADAWWVCDDGRWVEWRHDGEPDAPDWHIALDPDGEPSGVNGSWGSAYIEIDTVDGDIGKTAARVVAAFRALNGEPSDAVEVTDAHRDSVLAWLHSRVAHLEDLASYAGPLPDGCGEYRRELRAEADVVAHAIRIVENARQDADHA